MSHPNLIRADTFDLQNHNAPSAKDHSQQPAHPEALGYGPAAPHQGAALRHMHEERNTEQDYLADAWGSGRSSHEGSELLEEDGDYMGESGALHREMHSDAQAIQQNGGHVRNSEDSDMTDTDGEDADDDMVDKLSSSPSITDEDIDFEFVYALHTFVATVEGQANATKGDTMVLLDDSNSYWWLVRVVKDSSIGYLPAEHIETPTERLARLNKHRNIDLAQQMLTDNAEKSKNPIKKAMRRRNAKMVQFTTPTYYEASEVDWSDAENEQDITDMEPAAVQDNRRTQQSERDENTAAEGEKPNEQSKEIQPVAAESTTSTEPSNQSVKSTTETNQQAEDSIDTQDVTSSRSRNGTMRNTDSFFKDDTSEPKKISLTPNLLREANGESEPGSPRASESNETTSPTAESLEPPSPTSDKFGKEGKDDKRRKDKKSGMLSGLFKRKEKKLKVDEAAGGVVAKEGDVLLSPTGLSHSDSVSSASSKEKPSQSLRKTSGGKLVKTPPQSSGPSSGTSTPTSSGPTSGLVSPPNGAPKAPAFASPNEPPSVPAGQLNGIPRETSTESLDGSKPAPLRITPAGNVSAESKKEGGILSPLSNLIPQSDGPKKEKLKKAKQRMDLDVDSSPEREPEPTINARNAAHTPPPGRQPPSAPAQQPAVPTQRVSPVIDTDQARFAPLNLVDRPVSPVSPTTPTDSTLQTPETFSDRDPKTSTSTAPDGHDGEANEGQEPAWDDEALRQYLDTSSNTDVRDMLLIIHDKTGVQPVPRDHPIMVDLGYHKHQKQLNDMSTRLDGMLSSYMARKAASRKKAAVAA